MDASFRFLDHTADAGIEVLSPTLEGVFEAGGRGLFHLIAPSLPEPDLDRRVVSHGEERELLLANFLNDLLFLHEVEGLLFCAFKTASLEADRVVVDARCKAVDPGEGLIETVVKAVTLHGLTIVEEGTRQWKAIFYLDL